MPRGTDPRPSVSYRRPRRSARSGTTTRAAAVLCLVAGLGWTACGGTASGPGGNGDDDRPPASAGEPGVSAEEVPPDALETMAEGLDTPWELRFLPDGDVLVTERRGRLLRLTREAGASPPLTVAESHDVPDVEEAGEGGLMGLALHPAYPDPAWIYLCHTLRGGDGLENRVVRFTFRDGALSDQSVLLGDVPGASIHDGCRLEFGPDGRLYVTSGDAGDADDAQREGSLAGKIHRIGDDGSVPSDNPFGSPVWTLGHRNPQGLAFDEGRRLWSTEHGPSGMPGGRDELNRIESGENYGWPEITDGETREGLRAPVLHSGDATWAPAGLAELGGSLFFAGLRGSALYEARGVLSGGEVLLLAHFRDDFGRLRPVGVGPDGWLWFGTSNRDGRGSPAASDDRLLRVDPAVFDDGG